MCCKNLKVQLLILLLLLGGCSSLSPREMKDIAQGSNSFLILEFPQEIEVFYPSYKFDPYRRYQFDPWDVDIAINGLSYFSSERCDGNTIRKISVPVGKIQLEYRLMVFGRRKLSDGTVLRLGSSDYVICTSDIEAKNWGKDSLELTIEKNVNYKLKVSFSDEEFYSWRGFPLPLTKVRKIHSTFQLYDTETQKAEE